MTSPISVDRDPVREYLRAVFASDTTSLEHGAARRRLDGLRAELDAATAPRWEALAAWRLLASNSLRVRGATGRAAWDRANAMIASALAADEAPSFGLASRLHAEVEPDAVELRSGPVYAADERYLGAEDVAACVAELDAALLSARDGLEAAFRAYVGLVTIHPFANGNGRTARLTADYILMRDGRLPLCFASPVSSHVAQTYGGAARNTVSSFRVFAEGVANAYAAVLGER